MRRVLPKGHKDGVPFLMDDNLLRRDGLGAGLLLHQVVFAHKHPVGELGAGKKEQQSGSTTNPTEDSALSPRL